MTETSAKILLDSISPNGDRLTTMEVTLHRFVLAEFNTHRVFSRNSASSRAIPVDKMLQRFGDDFAFFASLPREQPGMQGGVELEGKDRADAVGLISYIHDETTRAIDLYLEDHPDKRTRLHKSVLNRLMEWGQWHTLIVSSTEWQNFFDQRCSPLAQPEMRIAAEAMRDALNGSEPIHLDYNEWHTPLIQPDEQFEIDECLRISAARCARVSYLTHDGKRDPQEDLNLFDRLMDADPKHHSPTEHVATPWIGEPVGNFKGWLQLRHAR